MTALSILWLIIAVLWAAVLSIAGIAVVNRIHHRQRTAREPETERPLARAATVAAAWAVSLRMARHLVVRGRPTPGRPEPAGTAHEGATEAFGPELRALRDAPLSPELVPVLTEAQQFAAVHDEFDKVMADFRHDLDHILDGICRQLDPLWARVDFPTGEMPIVRELVTA
jgi:hypothetical protein